MPRNQIDLSLSLSWQSIAILQILHHSQDSLEDLSTDLDIQTYAFYNGRERGVCLYVRPEDMGIDKPACLIAFAENRNSDTIFVWHVPKTHHTPRYGGVDIEAFGEESYEKRPYFDDVEEAAGHVLELLEAYALGMRKAS